MRVLAAIMLALLVATGCGGSDVTSSESGSTPASSVAATTTTAPPVSTIDTPTLAVEGPWDLVFFSDSSGFGVA